MAVYQERPCYLPAPRDYDLRLIALSRYAGKESRKLAKELIATFEQAWDRTHRPVPPPLPSPFPKPAEIERR